MSLISEIWGLFKVLDAPMQYIMIFTSCWFFVLLVFALKVKWNKENVFTVLAFIPVINYIIFYLFNYTKGDIVLGLDRHGTYGIIAVLYCVLCMFYAKRKKKKWPMVLNAVIAFCITIWSFVYVIFFGSHFSNFSRMGYRDSIASLIDELEQNYVLRDHKEIDFDDLRYRYIPLAEEAEKNKDREAFAVVVANLCYEFHDRHVDFVISDQPLWEAVEKDMSGNDYGFSMIGRDDGKTVAVLVDSNGEAYGKGLRSGMVITGWNGQDIDEAISKVRCVSSGGVISNFPIAETEDLFRPVYLSTMGGDVLNVRFIDSNGIEQEITVKSIGDGDLRRSQAVKPLTGCSHLIKANYDLQFAYTEMLDDHCGYLYIPREFYNVLRDRPAAMRDEYPMVKDLLISRIEELKAKGMDSLVIDIRGNIGGFPVICEEIISLFTNEEIVMYKGVYDGKEMRKNKEYKVKPDGRYSDLPVVVLTNSGCGSGGDILAYYLSRCPNVTLMGVTTSVHSAQAMGAECLLTDSFITVYYPMFSTLDSDGSVLIDPGKDRKGSIELDEKIPLNKETIGYLYNDGENPWIDYEADYARKYLNKKKDLEV